MNHYGLGGRGYPDLSGSTTKETFVFCLPNQIHPDKQGTFIT